MLDQIHDDLPKIPKDHNTYTLGSIGHHNIVIAYLPEGKIGTSAAATVATQMVSAFPSIKYGLLVGVGSGMPPKVRLGDLVVSTPTDQYSGVVQWDFGKAEDGGKFKRTGALNNPPSLLLTAVSKLMTEHELNGSKIPEYLEELATKYPRLAPEFRRPDSLKDILFKANSGHKTDDDGQTARIQSEDVEEEQDDSCRYCDKTQIVRRRPRDMRVHYGLIASGNRVIKDAILRDRIRHDLGSDVLCVEMEAAGMMDVFPCIVIRGISNYADSHNNNVWETHAAAVAAAFAKELLGCIPPSYTIKERAVEDILEGG
jgi:nucleoside phosphorylase